MEELAGITNINVYFLKAKLQEKDDALITLSDQVMKLAAFFRYKLKYRFSYASRMK